MRKGRALVRSEFGLDPDLLTDAEFMDRWCEAAWLRDDRLAGMARLLGLTEG